MEWLDAQEDEHHNANERKCRLFLKDRNFSLFSSNLPQPAKSPDEEKDQRDFVHLVVDHFVVLVDLKNKGIVNMVQPKYLDRSACRKQDEHHNKSYYVNIQA